MYWNADANANADAEISKWSMKILYDINAFDFQEVEKPFMIYDFRKIKNRETNMYMSLFLRSGKNEVIPVSLYIFDFLHILSK